MDEIKKRKIKYPSYDALPISKFCGGECKLEKSVKRDFYIRKVVSPKGNTGFHISTWCKVCARAYTKTRFANMPVEQKQALKDYQKEYQRAYNQIGTQVFKHGEENNLEGQDINGAALCTSQVLVMEDGT